jgi:hypothetical protein
MNERIREVWIKAAREDSDPDNWDTQEQFIERFAELIVRECINIADKSNTGSKSSNERTEFYYNADIGDKIKQHFGVEE